VGLKVLEKFWEGGGHGVLNKEEPGCEINNWGVGNKGKPPIVGKTGVLRK